MSAPERDDQVAGGEGAPPEDGACDERRREFLVGVKAWSLAVVGLAAAGAVLIPGEAHAWGNGGWVNGRGGYGGSAAGWGNHGGGAGWINGRGGGWVNGHGGGGVGVGWANGSGGHGGVWVNNRGGGGVGVGWVNHH